MQSTMFIKRSLVILSLAGLGSLLWRPVFLVGLAVSRSRRFTPSLEFLTEAWSNWRYSFPRIRRSSPRNVERDNW